MARVVALVGTASSSRLDANKEPQEVERWGLGRCWEWLSKCDRWFELHSRGWLLKRGGGNHVTYLAWMQQFPGPVYMLEPEPTIQTAVRYPFEQMIEEFGLPDSNGVKQPYFTSTVAYMLALAIHEKVDEVRFFGIDMSTEMEYGHQRAGCEYFIGVAKERGIKITIPKNSPIMKAEPYALMDKAAVNFDVLQERKFSLKRQETVAVEQLVRVRARRAELDRLLDAVAKGGFDQEDTTKRRDALVRDERIAEEMLVGLRSRLQENYHWINFVQGVDDVNALPIGSPILIMGGGKFGYTKDALDGSADGKTRPAGWAVQAIR